MRGLRICIAALSLCLAGSAAHAQKLWDGGGGDGQWTTAANWAGDTMPGLTDDVVLDNSFVSGSYIVTLSGGATSVCRTLSVGYTGNPNIITLHVNGTAAVQLNIVGDGTTADDLVVAGGGVIFNQSGAASGNVFQNTGAGNTARFRDGGRYVHGTARGFAGPFPLTGNGALTMEPNSTVVFQGSAPTALSASGRTFGNLTLSATAPKTYTTTGGNNFTIAGDLTLNLNVTLNTGGTGTAQMLIGGDMVCNGSGGTLTHAGGIYFNGATVISGAGTAPVIGNDAQVNAGSSLTVQMPWSIPATRRLTVAGTLAVPTSGTLTVAGTGMVSVTPAGTVEVGGTPISGAGTFDAASGSTLVISHPDGIDASDPSGAIQTATRTLPSGMNATFRFPAAITGDGIPGLMGTLAVDSSGDVELSKVAGASLVSIASGSTLSLGTQTLTLSGGGTVDGLLDVPAGGTISLPGPGLLGSGEVRLNTGANLVTKNPDGINLAGGTGAVQTTTRTIQDGVNFTFTQDALATSPAATGTGVFGAIGSLVIDNKGAGANGVTTITETASVNGSFQVIEGEASPASGRTLDLTTAASASVSATAHLNVGAGARLDVGDTPLTGGGAVTIGPLAYLAIHHAEGISNTPSTGAIQTTGARSFSPMATYGYYQDASAVANQLLGDALPASVAGLEVYNFATAPGVGTVLTQSTTVTGQLSVFNGRLLVGGHTLVAPDGVGGAGVADSAGWVVGPLTRNIDTALVGDRVFPVGTTEARSPLVLEPGASTGAGTVTVLASSGHHPNLPVATSLALPRTWTIVRSGLTLAGANLVAEWPGSDVGSLNEDNFSGALWDGAAWSVFLRPADTMVNSAANTGTVLGVGDAPSRDLAFWETPPASVGEWSLH